MKNTDGRFHSRVGEVLIVDAGAVGFDGYRLGGEGLVLGVEKVKEQVDVASTAMRRVSGNVPAGAPRVPVRKLCAVL